MFNFKNNSTYCFYCEDRELGTNSTNLINYTAGPVFISISTKTEEITLQLSSTQWIPLVSDLKETVIEAWEINEADIITINPITLKIKLTEQILLLYLTRNIVYVDMFSN